MLKELRGNEERDGGGGMMNGRGERGKMKGREREVCK